MKILLVNKFLYPKGGAETYVFKLGAALEENGHRVEYFGMENPGNIVGNSVNSYTSEVDFHGSSIFKQLTYPFRIIYSGEARRKIRAVLDDFCPDVVHLNNFNYQLTPSIILEIVKWRRKKARECKIVFTAHDPQLVCPNHMCSNPNTHENCEKCLGGKYINCLKGKCIHGSTLRSAIGMMEAKYWRFRNTYRYIDTMICCSEYLKTKIDSNPLFAKKTVAIHNFIDPIKRQAVEKEDYVLYFGRFSVEKGIGTLVEACKRLPHIRFVFAGSGPLNDVVSGVPNIENVGFKTGDELLSIISRARFSVCPSECYENCPFSVMESQMCGTPVIGANIGGIPELITPGITGELFESGNLDALCATIEQLWNNREICDKYAENCKNASFDTGSEYAEKMIDIYGGVAVAD